MLHKGNNINKKRTIELKGSWFYPLMGTADAEHFDHCYQALVEIP